ncbi:kinase-like protein [Obba rivulosa]|uniref:Kinase-like protein n=1 Tax=Obba rivulosa TaxID=1052685 RepID=A0A8E2AVL0_9APHY|nr:kinase-like protein [Obba rivulosa]
MWRRSLDIVRTLCGKNNICPSSFTLPEKSLQRRHERCMGSGGFADGNDVALKVWKIQDQGRINPDTVTDFCKEAVVLKYLRHPNITTFYGIETTIFPLCLVCEWMPLGTINSYLEQEPSSNRLALLSDVAAGLSYLHESNIVHGDLKGVSLLITLLGCLLMTHVAWNIAQYPDKSKAQSVTALIMPTSAKAVTIRWTAPEIVDPESFGLPKARVTRETDMYSFSMVMWEVFTGKIPFYNLHHDATVIYKVLSGVRPERPSQATGLGLFDAVWDVITQCWKGDQTARPTAAYVFDQLQEVMESAGPLETPQLWPLVIE